MRRALLLLPWFDAGGSEIVALDLAGMLGAQGWQVRCVATLGQRQALRPRFEQIVDRVTVLPESARSPAQALRCVEDSFGSHAPDLVLISNCEFAYEAMPWLRRRWPQALLVDLNHIEAVGWRNGGYPALSVARSSMLDLQLTVSEHLRGWMVERGASPDRVRVLHMHADPERWRPDEAARQRVRGELGLSPHEPVLLFAGRLAPQKRPLLLAAAARWLRERGASFRLLVAGDGEQGAQLAAALADEISSGQVRMLGLQSPERVRELMQAADLLVLPSAWEGIALVLYEAMACGLAVVATDVGGQRELVEPGTGVLVKGEGDAAERLGHALQQLLESSTQRQALQRAARRRILENFTPQHTHRRLQRLLADAAGRQRRPAVSALEAAGARMAALAGLRWDWTLGARREQAARAGTRQGLPLMLSTALGAGVLATLQAWRRQHA